MRHDSRQSCSRAAVTACEARRQKDRAKASTGMQAHLCTHTQNNNIKRAAKARRMSHQTQPQLHDMASGLPRCTGRSPSIKIVTALQPILRPETRVATIDL